MDTCQGLERDGIVLKLGLDRSGFNTVVAKVSGIRSTRGRKRLIAKLIKQGLFVMPAPNWDTSTPYTAVLRPTEALIAMIAAFAVADYVQGYR